MNEPGAYIALSVLLFGTGLFGVLCRRNIIAVLISIELILNAANINFLTFARFFMQDRVTGQIFSIFVIALAAAEICVALSFTVLLSRYGKSIYLDDIRGLKG